MAQRVRLFIWAVIAGGLLSVVGAMALASRDGSTLRLVLLMAAAAALVEVWAVALYGQSRVSISFTLVAGAAVLSGFSGAAIVGLGAGAGTILHQRSPLKVSFNAAVLVLAGGAMGATLDVLHLGLPDRGPALIGMVAIATSVNYAVNSVLVATVIGLTASTSPVAVWKEKHRWLFIHYLGLGLVGLALAEGYRLAGVFGVFVFIVPAILQRITLEQYVRRTERNIQQLKEQHQRLTESHSQLALAHRDLSKLTQHLEQTYDGTLLALVQALDARDSDTRGHSERVARQTSSLANHFGIREGSEQWEIIHRGALLHDVGKIGVADAVLLKPGRLTEAEQQLMREHPEIGFQMLHDIPFLEGAAEIVLTHHEHWDGGGYPRGMRRTEIPLGSRLFAVCDTFDAMMSDRPYRKALSVAQTLAEIQKFSGTQFDPEAVRALLELYESWLSEYPNHPDYLARKAA